MKISTSTKVLIGLITIALEVCGCSCSGTQCVFEKRGLCSKECIWKAKMKLT